MRALLLFVLLSVLATLSQANDLRPTPVQGSSTPAAEQRSETRSLPEPVAPASLSDPAKRPPTLDEPRESDERHDQASERSPKPEKAPD